MAGRRIHLVLNSGGALGRGVLTGVAEYANHREDWSFHTVPTQAIRLGADASPESGDAMLGAITTWLADAWAGEARGRMVNVSRSRDVDGAANVTVDDKAIGRLAAEYLLGKNLEHFAYFGPTTGSGPRCASFVQALELAGREVDVFATGDDPPPAGAPDAAAWLRGLPRPTGVLAFNDLVATELIRSARREGMLIPQDLAVMGVDNDVLVTLFSPVSVTTIDPDFVEVGRRAAAQLDGIFAGRGGRTDPIRVPPVGVIERHSTDFPGDIDGLAVRAARIIRDRACEGLTVGEVVASLPTTRRTLERRFKGAFNRSLHEEMTRIRMAEAARLLTSTRLRPIEITERVGYTDTKHFITVFRRHMGVPPVAYRKGHTSDAADK